MEKTSRSIAKALSYRFFGTLTTTTIVLAVVGKFEMAAAIGVTDTILKIGVYVIHERAWNKITFGREKQNPEYYI
jgi:uncharacterized membrane protein